MSTSTFSNSEFLHEQKKKLLQNQKLSSPRKELNRQANTMQPSRRAFDILSDKHLPFAGARRLMWNTSRDKS